MTRDRFSKRTLARFIARKLRAIEAEHDIDPNNGTAQLKGKPEWVNKAVAYGEREALLRIIEEFELEFTMDLFESER